MLTANAVTLLTGRQASTGDTFTLALGSPHDPATKPLTLSLGISWGDQHVNYYLERSIVKVSAAHSATATCRLHVCKHELNAA